MTNNFMETSVGNRPVVGDMQPIDVRLPDIVTSLSRMSRFLGHTSRFYSVAEHSVWVARALEWAGYDWDTVFAGLMHDAKEAYMGDWPTPIKTYFYERSVDFRQHKDMLERNIDSAICGFFGIDQKLIKSEPVVAADLGMLEVEAKRLMHSQGFGWTYSSEPMDIPFDEIAMEIEGHAELGLPIDAAASIFMDEYERIQRRGD